MSDKIDAKTTWTIWPWLFPLLYLIHVVEEYWAGVALATSPNKIRGANFTSGQFLIVNGLTFVLMLAIFILSQRFKFSLWLMVCVGTVLLINGLFHIKGTIKIAAYNPGLVTGTLLFVPLGIATLVVLKSRMSGRRYWTALITGILINFIVLLVARGGRKLFEL